MLFCFRNNGNLISIDDFATEECLKTRDVEKAALSSMIKNIGGRFDLHLSVFASLDEMAGERKLSITCFKIDKAREMSATDSPKRPRTGEATAASPPGVASESTAVSSSAVVS